MRQGLRPLPWNQGTAGIPDSLSRAADMAQIIVGSYMVRYPMGGMMSWVLQYLIGFRQLGHDVYFVEKSGYPDSCFDPTRRTMSDDCSYGVGVVGSLLERFGLKDRWCYVDAAGVYYGMARPEIEETFRSADLFFDMGTHGNWLDEAARTGIRVLVDGEPAFTQMKMENRLAEGESLPEYDRYYTTGRNIGTVRSTAPTAGKTWHPLFHPVSVDLFSPRPAGTNYPFTTVMNWQSYEPVRYNGVVYGHKNVEFDRFVRLPRAAAVPLEIAVSGKKIPLDLLRANGWRVRDAQLVSFSFDSFVDYIYKSRGEFSVCKSGYVSTRSGWFSDRSAAYLAAGRPVVLQETGFSEHLPCGEGLFAVEDERAAADALREIHGNYSFHAKRAREVAVEYLDTRVVLEKFLDEIGIAQS
jgi:hypothetical protein